MTLVGHTSWGREDADRLWPLLPSGSQDTGGAPVLLRQRVPAGGGGQQLLRDPLPDRDSGSAHARALRLRREGLSVLHRTPDRGSCAAQGGEGDVARPDALVRLHGRNAETYNALQAFSSQRSSRQPFRGRSRPRGAAAPEATASQPPMREVEIEVTHLGQVRVTFSITRGPLRCQKQSPLLSGSFAQMI